MRTTQSGHEWAIDSDGDVVVQLGGYTPVYLDEMDLVGMLRKVRLARMATTYKPPMPSGVSKS